MSAELFERMRPYFQAMLDGQQSSGGETPGLPPTSETYTAVQFMDNYTGKWHRVYLYGGKMYLELAEYNDGLLTSKPPGGDDLIPPPGSDEDLKIGTSDDYKLDTQAVKITTIK